MCVGVPMQVVSVADGTALCRVDDELRTVSTLLLGGACREGDHVLVHASAAIRIIDAREAQQVGDALRAVVAAAEGRAFEHLLADLIDREPELPAHLRAASQTPCLPERSPT
jgi:hydrogenase expression/formation protein HypC